MAKDGEHLTQVSISQTGAGTVTVKAVSDPQGIVKLVSLFVVVDTDDTTLQVLSEAAAITGAMPFKKGGGIGAKGTVEEPLLKTIVAGDDLKIVSVGGGFKGFATFYIEGE